jgi:hypothetical protein
MMERVTEFLREERHRRKARGGGYGHRCVAVQCRGQFLLVEGLIGRGSFRAKTDKKGKKGQRT